MQRLWRAKPFPKKLRRPRAKWLRPRRRSGSLLKAALLLSERVRVVDFFCHPVGKFSQFHSQPFNSVRVIFGNLFSERSLDLFSRSVLIDI